MPALMYRNQGNMEHVLFSSNLQAAEDITSMHFLHYFSLAPPSLPYVFEELRLNLSTNKPHVNL